MEWCFTSFLFAIHPEHLNTVSPSKVRTLLGGVDILAAPHHLKGLCEGLDFFFKVAFRVRGSVSAESPHKDGNASVCVYSAHTLERIYV